MTRKKHRENTLPIMPAPQQNPKIENAFALFVLSVISLTILRATPELPFIIPHKALAPIAHHKFLLKPNKQEEIVFPIKPVNKTGLLPYRSDTLPHIIAVQNCAIKKTDAATVECMLINLGLMYDLQIFKLTNQSCIRSNFFFIIGQMKVFNLYKYELFFLVYA